MRLKCDSSSDVCKKWHPAIEEVIKRGVSSTSRGADFSLNMKALANELGISRPTLYRHEVFIETVIARLRIDRKRTDGSVARVALEDRIAQLEARLDASTSANLALRQSLANVFHVLATNRSPILALVTAELHGHVQANDVCPLCGTSDVRMEFKSNVISLAKGIPDSA